MDLAIAAGYIVAGLLLVLALAGILAIGIAAALAGLRDLFAWRRRRRPRKLHRWHAHYAPRPCRCPNAPCPVHPFAFDVERLLAPHA